ncbi:MAG: HEPN domain-containing protein [Tepidamorphaceae bacterium]
MPLIEVKNRFLRDESKQAELEIFLSAQDCSQSESGIIDYGANINFIDVVRVHFSKEGKMKSIQCHAESADRLEQRIEDAIYTDHGKAVGRRVIFTNIGISEQFRLGDDFQIIPVPPDSPEIEYMMGDHPALLEFSYDKSPNNILDNHRSNERADELRVLISAFVFGGIKWINNHADKYWVIEKSETGKWTSQYRQELYTCDDWKLKDGIGFSVLSEIDEIPLMKPTSYFTQLGIIPGNKFHLPTTIGEYFRKYDSLSLQDREMALLSAHWLQKSSVVYSASASLSFSAIVYALESLIRNPARIGDCDTCGQAIYERSISESFRELIETHARDVPKKSMNDIYALRSKIAHGSGLIAHDQNVGFRFSDPLMKSRDLHHMAMHVCQVVFINWLMSRA